MPAGYAVDWLRSAYRTKHRFFTNTILETPGRFVFAPAGTPFAPIPTIFGSNVWVTDDGVGQLGELPGARSLWENGSTPGPWPPPLMLGDPNEVTNGAPFPHAQVLRTLPYGFDSRWWTLQQLPIPPWPYTAPGTVGELEAAYLSFGPALFFNARVGELSGANVKNGVALGAAVKVGELSSAKATHHP